MSIRTKVMTILFKFNKFCQNIKRNRVASCPGVQDGLKAIPTRDPELG